MPEIDHRIGEDLECAVQLTEALKTKQEPPELIFPGKHPLDRVKSFLKYRRVKQRLAASLGLRSAAPIRVDVGDHAAIEDGFAVGLTVIDAIEADKAAPKIHTHILGDADHFGQGFAQQR